MSRCGRCGQDDNPRPYDLDAAMARVASERRALAGIKAFARLISLCVFLSMASISGGIATGCLGVFRTASPITCFIIPGILAFIASASVKFTLTKETVPNAEHDLRRAEIDYRAVLNADLAA